VIFLEEHGFILLLLSVEGLAFVSVEGLAFVSAFTEFFPNSVLRVNNFLIAIWSSSS
jgi:hypothetical protein